MRLLLLVLGACTNSEPEDHSDDTHADDTGHAGDTGHTDDHTHGTGELDEHIHGIEFWGDGWEVVIGTHEGVFRTDAAAGELVAVFDEPADFMSFLKKPNSTNTYWGSGHYSAGGYGNWGFIESTDGAASWNEVSLTGSVDFHILAASHDDSDTVVGYFSGEFYVSDDAGRSWSNTAWSGDMVGLEVESTTGPALLVANSSGIQRLTLPSLASETLLTASVTGFDRVSDGYMYGTSNGAIHHCDSMMTGCAELETAPVASGLHFRVHPDDSNVIVVLTTGSQVYHSDDRGASWELVISGI